LTVAKSSGVNDATACASDVFSGSQHRMQPEVEPRSVIFLAYKPVTVADA
jgi:hypothetical protein